MTRACFPNVSSSSYGKYCFQCQCLFSICKLCLRYTAENFKENPSTRALAKILRARASEHHLISASNSSKGQILRALSNWMGPFNTPFFTRSLPSPFDTLGSKPYSWRHRAFCIWVANNNACKKCTNVDKGNIFSLVFVCYNSVLRFIMLTSTGKKADPSEACLIQCLICDESLENNPRKPVFGRSQWDLRGTFSKNLGGELQSTCKESQYVCKTKCFPRLN